MPSIYEEIAIELVKQMLIHLLISNARRVARGLESNTAEIDELIALVEKKYSVRVQVLEDQISSIHFGHQLHEIDPCGPDRACVLITYVPRGEYL